MALRPPLNPPARTLRLPEVTVAAPEISLADMWSWLVRHREAILVATLLLAAGLAHGVNMFHFPYYEDDEGTYMSQAWAVIHLGKLAPYTYWYDHAPGGWLQIALWAALTGGFHTFGALTAQDGRVMMLLLHLASTFLVYGIARRISGSVLIATTATLLFIFSAYGIFFERRVLLDNITTPWMLLSIFVLLGRRLSLLEVWLSAFALGMSILSKELTTFLIPGMVWLVFLRTHRSQRLFALIGWLAITISMISLYVLLAILKGELFPSANRVSLLGSTNYQASRRKDGGLLDLHSGFWVMASHWIRDEPLLVIGGTACAVLALTLAGKRPVVAVIGVLTLSLWAFMARGGVVIEFYLVPLLPLLALNIALMLGVAVEAVRHVAERAPSWLLRVRRVLKLVAAGTVLAGLGFGYVSPHRGFAGNHLVLWTSTQADAQQQAYNWVEAHLPRTASILMDNYAYTDLHDGADGYTVFPQAQYYWKLDRDPAILAAFHGTWKNTDYLLSTIQLQADVAQAGIPLTSAALAHSVTLAHFDTGGWPVEVRLVVAHGRHAPNTGLPLAQHLTFGGAVETKNERTLLTLVNPGILPDSVHLIFYFRDGSVVSRIVDIDASSRETIDLGNIEPNRGSFGLSLQADHPLAAYAALQRPGTGGDLLLTGQAMSTIWNMQENYSGLVGQKTLSILNPDPTRAAQVRLQLRSLATSAPATVHLTVPAHTLITKQLQPLQATSVAITASRPVSVGQLPSFSATGYRLAMNERGDSSATNWMATTAGVPGQSRTIVTLFSPSCAATLDSSVTNGTPIGGSLLEARCRSANALQRFVNGSVHSLIGTQRTIPQGEYFGSPGDADAGAALFGEAR